MLAFFHKPYIELDSFIERFKTDPFVVTVNGRAFLTCQVHSREAINSVGYSAVVTRVGALYHKIGRYDAALPGRCYRGCYLIPALAVGSGDAAGIHSALADDLDRIVVDRFFEVIKRTVDSIVGIESDV